jgi:hypothetical protein
LLCCGGGMQNVLQKNQRLLFYAGWFLINIVQAATTELLDDEAYYWVYSRFLDWGYFDHPPMVAALIKAGYALFHNELGVRLIFVALNTATIFILQELTGKKDERLFYAVAGSVVIAQIGGILAAPDIPLLFFTALFFLLFRHFLQRMNVINTLLLGICMALMLYSKYHGVLIIFFAFLSNIKLLTKWQAYGAGLVCLLLFAPHLYWQYIHNYPSLQYHLFERNASHYKFSYTTDYILGQIILAGPLMGWLLLWAAYKHRPITGEEKAMQYAFLGTYFRFPGKHPERQGRGQLDGGRIHTHDGAQPPVPGAPFPFAYLAAEKHTRYFSCGGHCADLHDVVGTRPAGG